MAYYWCRVRNVDHWISPRKEGSELRANCLGDLRTSGDHDALSVWLIDDDLLPLVAMRLGKTWKHIQNVSYLKLPAVVVDCEFPTLDQCDEGTTPAPLRGKHYDLRVGTAARLVALAERAAAAGEHGCLREAQLRKAILAAIERADLRLDYFDEPSLRKEISFPSKPTGGTPP